MTRIPPQPAAPGSVAGAPRTWRIGHHPWRDPARPGRPHARVIVDNDFAGDPDDLFQLVHHLLSPSVDVRAVVASHLPADDALADQAAAASEAVARDVFAKMGCLSTERIYRGAAHALRDTAHLPHSPGARAIVAEAMREEEGAAPLYVVAGGGLTDLATALIMEPRIASRLTAVWIGGPEYPELAAPPPGAPALEYNMSIDVAAAQVVFAHPELALWQVPRNVYRQCLISEAELWEQVALAGPLGRYLYQELQDVVRAFPAPGGGLTETYCLGDSPLVLLTALQSLFEPDAASSEYTIRPAPRITPTGQYEQDPAGKKIRVFTRVDTRLIFGDFAAKLRELETWQAGLH